MTDPARPRRYASARRFATALLLPAVLAGCAGTDSGISAFGGSVDGALDTPPSATECASQQAEGTTAAPTNDLPGWDLTFVDDFDRCDLGADWGVYTGDPGGNPHSTWEADMVSLADGTLRLHAHRDSAGDWTTGGVSNHRYAQRYGRWEVRMRARPAADVSYHLLLWPQADVWPPEIDFAESVSEDRSEMSAFLHWIDDGGRDKSAAHTTGDFTRWHTVGVEWGPGIVRLLYDGRVWAEARSETMVPDIPMWLALQSEAGACERRLDWGMSPCASESADGPDSGVAVEIDWVAVYAPDMPALERMHAAGEFDPTPGAVRLDR